MYECALMLKVHWLNVLVFLCVCIYVYIQSYVCMYVQYMCMVRTGRYLCIFPASLSAPAVGLMNVAMILLPLAVNSSAIVYIHTYIQYSTHIHLYFEYLQYHGTSWLSISEVNYILHILSYTCFHIHTHIQYLYTYVHTCVHILQTKNCNRLCSSKLHWHANLVKTYTVYSYIHIYIHTYITNVRTYIHTVYTRTLKSDFNSASSRYPVKPSMSQRVFLEGSNPAAVSPCAQVGRLKSHVTGW